jgi:hypothetical protein
MLTSGDSIFAFVRDITKIRISNYECFLLVSRTNIIRARVRHVAICRPRCDFQELKGTPKTKKVAVT